ncbi:MAG: hypothetical protein AAFY08_14430 [Planctomycetota bacterium]
MNLRDLQAGNVVEYPDPSSRRSWERRRGWVVSVNTKNGTAQLYPAQRRYPNATVKAQFCKTRIIVPVDDIIRRIDTPNSEAPVS